VGRVASADVSPARPPVDIGEKPEQPTMARRETGMLGVDLADQIFFTARLHPDLVRSRGRMEKISNIRSDVKDIDHVFETAGIDPQASETAGTDLRGNPSRARSSGRAPSR
jgi:hypothetical protein